MNDHVIQNEYFPDYVSPPGETLQEILEMKGMTQANLARRTGRPNKTINEIIQGKTAITPETALQLERVLGVPASFWFSREQQYREALARLKEEEALAEHVGWLKEVPVRAMVKLGWIRVCSNRVQQLREVLGFFGVVSEREWAVIWDVRTVAFRQSAAFQANPYAVAAWLRKGEIEAQSIDCMPYDEDRFRQTLSDVRALTTESAETIQSKLINLCALSGVAVVFVPELPKIRTSGATRWLTPNKALIQLSLRYKTNDQLWFTFFHEAGHILLHGKREVFLEENGADDNAKEHEANEFAANILIPPDDWKGFLQSGEYTEAAIRRFAAEIGIAPGIVVGRLQHEELLEWKSSCNKLKVRYKWVND